MLDKKDVFYHIQDKNDLSNIRHSHPDAYEMIQIWRGSGWVTIKNSLYPMTRGALYFINTEDTHCTSPRDNREYERNKLMVPACFINELARAGGFFPLIEDLFLQNGGSYFPLSESQMQQADQLFLTLSTRGDNESLDHAFTVSCLVQLLTLSRNRQAASGTATRLSEIFQYVNQNITNDLSVEQISEHLHINKYYLCHYFKKETHMTLTEYMTSRRFSIAKKLLRETDLPIGEIALNAGFHSFSYFTQVFRKLEGLSPREFRAGQRKQTAALFDNFREL